MSFGGSSTETNTVTEPWATAQPFLRQGLRQTQRANQQGWTRNAFKPFQGKSIADLNNRELQGMASITQNAGMGNQALQGSIDQLQRIQSGAISNPMQAAPQNIGDILVSDRVSKVGAPGSVMQVDAPGSVDRVGAAPSVRGVNYGDLDAVTGNILDSVIPEVNSVFANSGMDGSPMQADALARSASSALAPVHYSAFMQAQGMNQSADAQNAANFLNQQGMNQNASAIDVGNYLQQQGMNQTASARDIDNFLRQQGMNQSAEAQNMGLAFNQAQANAGIAGQNVANDMAVARANQLAGSDDISRMMQASGMMPGLADATLGEGRALMDIGRIQRDQRQAQLADREADWLQNNTARIRSQEWYNDQLRAFGGMGGTQTSVAPSPGVGQQLVGGGLMGLGTYGALTASGVGAPVAIGGGILAGLGSLF